MISLLLQTAFISNNYLSIVHGVLPVTYATHAARNLLLCLSGIFFSIYIVELKNKNIIHFISLGSIEGDNTVAVASHDERPTPVQYSASM